MAFLRDLDIEAFGFRVEAVLPKLEEVSLLVQSRITVAEEVSVRDSGVRVWRSESLDVCKELH